MSRDDQSYSMRVLTFGDACPSLLLPGCALWVYGPVTISITNMHSTCIYRKRLERLIVALCHLCRLWRMYDFVPFRRRTICCWGQSVTLPIHACLISSEADTTRKTSSFRMWWVLRHVTGTMERLATLDSSTWNQTESQRMLVVSLAYKKYQPLDEQIQINNLKAIYSFLVFKAIILVNVLPDFANICTHGVLGFWGFGVSRGSRGF